MQFTEDQNQVWSTLIKAQLPLVREHACDLYLEGYRLLELPEDHIPSLDMLNQRITPLTGWKTIRTQVRYSDAIPWYQAFAQRHFLITEYMRGWHELEFTPEPDMFHDIFGHLPFMTLSEYSSLQEMFAPAFLRADEEQRENIKRLAWFSTEFGLIRQKGEIKAFGAGLISSKAELMRVMDGTTKLQPFTIENVLHHDKAIWDFNETLFWFDSIVELKDELNRYLKQSNNQAKAA